MPGPISNAECEWWRLKGGDFIIEQPTAAPVFILICITHGYEHPTGALTMGYGCLTAYSGESGLLPHYEAAIFYSCLNRHTDRMDIFGNKRALFPSIVDKGRRHISISERVHQC